MPFISLFFIVQCIRNMTEIKNADMSVLENCKDMQVF